LPVANVKWTAQKQSGWCTSVSQVECMSMSVRLLRIGVELSD
jgi:hypothetical protein